ncbi:hypothetical protein PVAP13_3NG265200 [Panicum virgatum]|uniref:Uncharacterized protein n=1 Tax=Panicum virgatum TaxID=38727 RepID=A0A8T0UK01_PANVG|nr:hypothetical protein PVAP13_3NG265200 [Panicum virgatum]
MATESSSAVPSPSAAPQLLACCCRAARPPRSLSTRPHSLPSRIGSDRIGFLRSDPPLPSPADSTPSSPVQVTFTAHSNPSSSEPQRQSSSDLPYPGDRRDCPKPRVGHPLCLR